MPYEELSECLLDDKLGTTVIRLKQVQNATEKALFEKRLKLVNHNKGAHIYFPLITRY